MLLLLVSSQLVLGECVPKRTPTGRIARSTNEVVKFKKLNPCPVSSIPGKYCPGYVVDHVVPLCLCGPDKIANMQWQSLAESKVKDTQERKQCKGIK